MGRNTTRNRITLTETLKEYWIERAKKLTEESEPIKNKVRLDTSPAQWNRIQDIIENISRETSQDLKRKKSTVRLEQNKSIPQQERQNTREGSRGPSPISPTSANIN